MSSRSEVLTPSLLRDWSLPKVGDSKYGRGDVLVIGEVPGQPLVLRCWPALLR